MTTLADDKAPRPSVARFERNLARLASVAPDLHGMLAGMAQPPGMIVAEPSDPTDWNFRVDGQLLHQRGLRSRAREAIAAYLKAPSRLGWAAASTTKSPIIDHVRNRIDPILAARGLTDHAPPGHHRAAVLIVFGIGLGEEVRLLLEAMTFRHVVLVEPDWTWLWHSMTFQDWAAIYDAQAERGGALHIISGNDPVELAQQASRVLTSRGTIQDGAYYLINYTSPDINACLQHFRTRLTSISDTGYFEDDMIMLENATRNLRDRAARFIRNDRPAAKPCPAIIVGAGPSLDKALPHLARLRDQAVVFSAGSTLGTLLRHGIVPDFQCEIENTPENYEVLRRALARDEGSSTRLLASATVDPRLPDLFSELMFYLRAPGISSDVYGDPAHSILGTAPNCATLAMRMASRFGFSEVYLFGTDFGTKRPEIHHVSDSIWVTDPTWSEMYDREGDHMVIEMPGNFGGKAYSSPLLEFFLTAARGLIAASTETRFFNCSDGVRIDGALPKAPGAVRLTSTPTDRERALEDIIAATDFLPAGAGIDIGRVMRFRDQYSAWNTEIAADLGRRAAAGADLIDLHDAVVTSLEPFAEHSDETAGVATMAWGSLSMMLRYALHFAIRHDLLADREFVLAVTDGLRAALAAMTDAVDGLLERELALVPRHG